MTAPSAKHSTLHHLEFYNASTPSEILNSSVHNKGTAFTRAERDRFGLNGLLPFAVESIEQQTKRALHQVRTQSSGMAKHIFLQVLRGRNETLFFALLVQNFVELAPFVYTPTVGLACQKFSNEIRGHCGLFLSKYDKGRIASVLDNWSRPEVDIIVVTDGSRILGLGDLGANGMGIPIGKLILYTAAAGFHPSATLPITIDVGTNNDVIRNDPRYVGVPEKRTLTDEEYYAFLDEFMAAVYAKWPHVLVQFEDFSNDHCFVLLERYREKYLTFNDDIQGTGAVVAAGLVNAWRAAKTDPSQQRFVFLGAGSAGVGVANQIVDVLVEKGVAREDAFKQFYFVDSKGLVAHGRGDTLADHKMPFARNDVTPEQLASLVTLSDVVEFAKPTALLGLSGQGGSFDDALLKRMGEFNERPIIFALSNPTSKAECTARAAYENTGGRAVFASGSPFDPVTLDDGQTLTPGQGNNMYVFPGLGLGASLCAAERVTDSMVSAAVTALAATVSDEQLTTGAIYPDLTRVREVSAVIAVAVIERAMKEGLARAPPVEGEDIMAIVQKAMYAPTYGEELAKL